MKEYYYITNGEQFGPINLNDLVELNLDTSTLVWTEDLPNWIELKNLHGIKSIPPPIPKSITKKTVVTNSEKLISSKTKFPLFLICWITFNSIALVLSYSDIDNLGDGVNSESPSKFWPFIDFYHPCMPLSSNTFRFVGIFAEYDWSEFSLYVGFSIFIYILIKRK